MNEKQQSQILQKTSQCEPGAFYTEPVSCFEKKDRRRGEFCNPYGVAFEPKHKVIVASEMHNHRLQVFSQQDGEFLAVFGSNESKNSQFEFPRGVCFQPTTDNMIVTDSHRLQVFSVSELDFKHLFTVGSAKEGSKPAQFDYPKGVCCTARGDIVVADHGNNRMQIFDCRGLHVRAFGSHGQGNNQFDRPCDVCAQGDANRMVITDWGNIRLSAWSVDGSQPVLTVPVEGLPHGICSDPHSHRIVVSCDGSDDITVLDSKIANEWKIIQQFGTKGKKPGQFFCPFSVCIDDRGALFVADYFNHRVQVFQPAVKLGSYDENIRAVSSPQDNTIHRKNK